MAKKRKKADDKTPAKPKEASGQLSEANTDNEDDKTHFQSINDWFESANENSAKIVEIRDMIKGLDEKISMIKDQKKTFRAQIKPQKRAVKRSKAAGSTQKPVAPYERNVIRTQMKFFSSEITLLQEQKADKVNELRNLCRKAKDEFASQNLANKAHAKNYLNRNQWYVRGRLVRFLNNTIETNPAVIRSLINLARSNSEASIQNFNSQLGDLLGVNDPNTYALCSGLLKSKLYEAVRLTLRARGQRDNSEIEELILPPEEE